MKIHELKCWHNFYIDIACREKTFELRKNDRDYRVNDLLLLRDYFPSNGGRYTGSEILAKITYVLGEGHITCQASPEALHKDFVILGIKILEEKY